MAYGFMFRCIASRLPHAPTTSNIRRITYITIDLGKVIDHRGRRMTTYIDWGTFLHTVRQFPHLQQIVIQYKAPYPRHVLVEFLAHLGEAWFGLDEPLGLYYNDGEWNEPRWVQSRLDTLMDEIKQRV